MDLDKVILFGSHATGHREEHGYTEDGITYKYISDYDILVITKSGGNRKDYEVQDVIAWWIFQQFGIFYPTAFFVSPNSLA